MRDHLTEDELVLHFYDEESGLDAVRIEAHLAVCPGCTALWNEISDTLTLAGGAVVPDPGPAFERMLWARVAGELPRPAAGPVRWLVPVAASLVIVAVAAGGLAWLDGRSGTSAPSGGRAHDASDPRERVLLTALDGHFADAEILLVELLNTPERDVPDLAFERATADDLVASGRLYRQTARQTGEARFTEVLEDLEAVFVEVARSPDPIDRRELEALRAQIDDYGLLFKVRAVTHEIRGRQQGAGRP